MQPATPANASVPMLRWIVHAWMVLVVACSILAFCHTHGKKQRAHTHAALTARASTSSTQSHEETDDLIAVDLRNRPAPEFSLHDLRGRIHSLKQYRGHLVVVNFWSTECEPCLTEMPRLNALQDAYRSQGLVILGIDQDPGSSIHQVAQSANRAGAHYPILLPDKQVAKRYGGVEYLPETFYITRDGLVRMQTVGENSGQTLEANIRKTLAYGKTS